MGVLGLDAEVLVSCAGLCMLTYVFWEAFVATRSDEDFELLLSEDLCSDNEIIEREWAIQMSLPRATRSSCQLWKKLGR